MKKVFKAIKEALVDFLLSTEKNYLFLINIGILIFVIWFAYDLGSVISANNTQTELGGRPTQTITTEEMIKKIESNNEKSGVLYINFDEVKYKDLNDKIYKISDFNEKINKESLDKLKDKLDVKGKADIKITPQNKSEKQVLPSLILDFLLKIGFLALYVIIIVYVIKHFMPSKYGINGKKFQVFDKHNRISTKIKDVAGQGDAKKEVIEIVDYLKAPQKYQKVGAKMPRGILLYGPPGTGKTILAKAIAGEAECSLIMQSASSFVDTYVGQGASGVRSIFKEARKIAPCVIFIDEIDAIATKRSMGGSEERLQTLTQLLTEMSGFEDNEGIVVIAATNRLEILDEAITRPGRFDRKVLITLPTEEERVEILNIYIDKEKISHDVSVEKVAKKAIGFSGADLENLVNEAAIEAARSNKNKIDMIDFNLARDRILMGTKNSMILNNNEHSILAFHELGHASLAYLKKRKVEKVSIVPRGNALGVTITELKNEVLKTEEDMKNDIIILMGGRAAEKIFFNGNITTGSYDDINKASEIARDMVNIFGFYKDTPYISENSSIILENERLAENIVKDCYVEAEKLLSENQEKIKNLHHLLIAHKEVSGLMIEDELFKN